METRALLQILVVMWAGLTSAQDPIIFPGDMVNETVTHPSEADTHFPPIPKKMRTTVRPSCSLRAGVDENSPCVDDEEYDEGVRSHIEHILQQTGLKSLVETQLFQDLLNDYRVVSPIHNVETRIRGFTETPVCHAQEDYIYPKRAKTANNVWVYILNHDNIKQAVRVEKCINEGRQCEYGAPPLVKTYCKQKYVYVRLLTAGNDKIRPDDVLMPSCCVCYKRSSDFDIASRSRLPDVILQPMNPVTPTDLPFDPTHPTGQPVNSVQSTGQPFNPTHPTGQPVNPTHPTGQPVNSVQPTGQPVNSVQPTGQPVNSGQPTGQPVNSVQPTGQPVNSVQPTGQPVNSVQPTGQPVNSVQPTGQPVNSVQPTGQPSNPVEPIGQPFNLSSKVNQTEAT